MAETSENLFKLTGGIALFILDAPKSSKEMMKAELPITSIVKQLRWLKGHNKLDFEWIWKELIRIHDQLDSYENCALRE